MQGVRLLVESEENKGSSFWYIQEFRKTASRIERVSTNDIPVGDAEEKPFKGIRVLLVEDNRMNVMVARSFLQNWGIEVDVAENGQEALSKLNIMKHQLILMDLHMPVMDGYEASQKIRERGIAIPIIALTANLREDIE